MPEFHITGLDEFEKALINTLTIKYPLEVQKKISEIATNLMWDAQVKTPIGSEEKKKSKRMKYRWKVGKPRMKNGEMYIEVKNTAPHAHLVEDGHNIVTEDGKTVGFVEGKHILLLSVEKLEQSLTPQLQGWLNNVLKELEI